MKKIADHLSEVSSLHYLVLIIVGGFAFRAFALDWGLPNDNPFHLASFHPDEMFGVISILYLIENPLSTTDYINTKGAGYFNLSAVFVYIAHLLDFISIKNGDIDDISSLQNFYLVARFVNVILSTATIGLTYLVGKSLVDRKHGLLAALFVAISPVLIISAHYVKSDTSESLFILLSLYFAVQAKYNLKFIWCSMFFAGVAGAFKYPGISAVVFGLISALIFVKDIKSALKYILGGVPFVILGFLLVFPLPLFDLEQVATGIYSEFYSKLTSGQNNQHLLNAALYSWDFGDRDKSSNKTTKHSYSELSPKEIGFYDVKLLVSDKDDPTLQAEDSVQINVINQAPTFSSIQAVPETKDGDLITPVRVEVKAHGAEDEDGEITQYRWWYFDLDDPDEALGIQITKIPSARLNIGTHGKEGQKITYGIGLQVTDSDNIKVSSSDFLQEAQIPTVEVTNGKNDLPEAKFKVNVTKTFTGEKVTFTSASKDSDGEIEEYIWDFEGDGFFNNDPTSEASVEHIYEGKNLEGYEVRLKVIDDKGGESISDPIKIYIDSLANPPKAAFKFELVTGSAGKKVKFINNSTADQISGATIISYKWDFDTASILESADSDGDGAKDNDIDSQLKDPSRLYTEFGKYFVKLTIVDDQGNIDTITRELSVPLASPPTAAFTYSASGSQIIFQNNSTADEEGGAKLSKFTWDFDTDSDLITADSNGDGQKDNDDDSNEKNPVYTYPQAGTYNVKLSVIDDFGSSSEVTRPVVFGPQKDIRFGQDVGKTLSGLGAETSAGNPLASSGLSSLLETVPAPSEDGIIYIEGDAGQVTFDFSKSKGQISYYVIDKNIYFDTNGNGIKNDDSDFKTILPGTWKTNFEKIWGKTVVKLTIIDIYGNEHSSIREIKFK